MGKPKITIITVTYNSGRTLCDTIKSIRKQNYDNLEYIIVDGGSSDNTINIVQQNEDIISKWISEPDNGISDAFNKGIEMATGDIIGIINSDDLLTDNSLQIVASIYEPTLDVIYGNAIMFGENVTPYRYKPHKKLKALYKTMALVHPATFVSAKAYRKFGVFNTKYKCNMDRELLLRVYIGGGSFQYVDKDLAMMRLGGTNQKLFLSTTLPEAIEISIKYGMNPLRAYAMKIYHTGRFILVNKIRTMRIGRVARSIFHSKNTDLSYNKLEEK